MGQYHIICNLRKLQYLHPHKFGSGLKALEFSVDGMGPMTGLAYLLIEPNPRGGGDFNTGSWAGNWRTDPLAIIGDYCCVGDLPGYDHLLADGGPLRDGRNLWGWEDISLSVIEEIRSLNPDLEFSEPW